VATILEFKRPEGAALHDALNTIIEDLESFYTGIEKAETELESVYQACALREEEYNKVLGKYATLVGDDNIEEEYLNYSSEVEIFFIPETEEMYAKYTSVKQLELFTDEELEQ